MVKRSIEVRVQSCIAGQAKELAIVYDNVKGCSKIQFLSKTGLSGFEGQNLLKQFGTHPVMTLFDYEHWVVTLEGRHLEEVKAGGMEQAT